MSMKLLACSTFALFAAALAIGPSSTAAAMTMKECGAKYESAKKAGTLGGQDWKAYRTANCSATAAAVSPAASAPSTAAPAAAAVAPTAPAPAAPVAAAAPAPTPASTPAPSPGKSAAPAVADSGNAVFPAAVSPKYASLKGGRARMKTCDDQYKANKATGGNGGMKWIQKGGGYYSVCEKRLKGA